MDQAECIKLGLNRTGGGWFNSILGGSGSGSAGSAAGAGANYNKESLTEAFVKFLEKESAPRPVNTAGGGLLNIMAHQSHPQAPVTASRTTTPPTQTPPPPQQTPMDHNQNPAGVASAPPMVIPVQPILLGGESNTLLQQTTTFQAQRSSSSILKDILSDS
ncbi:uncharacterized protein LOC134285824 [Aedes albopictus]|uniref:Uncharacterized protein n=1 Tax=Aedes albopictus TaxID=7160 RepID=A0ABM1ZEE7_AEDAL